MFIIFALILFITAVGASAEDSRRPVVGAIRWDAWRQGSEFEANLAPPQWRSRLPFYAHEKGDTVEVRGDRQEVMDKEILYASGAGLSYWAFCYYHPKSWPGADAMNYGLRLYHKSRHRAKINYCLILLSGGTGPASEWPETAAGLVRRFKEAEYQKVMGGRPLLFSYGFAEEMPARFGSEEAARRAIEDLREKCRKEGVKSPYIAAQVWDARTGAALADRLGLDAVSAYAWVDFAGPQGESPYRTLASSAERFWDACKAAGKKVIPLVTAGWDNRPRWVNSRRYRELYKSPPGGPWHAAPSPQEIARHVRAAVRWIRSNPDAAESGAAIVYAWNESDEGGWLVPTLSEGAARLDALRRVLKPAAALRP
ncbi:MAG: hypothetical protein IT210_10015 [Armatimonadetes bacterium]|nr:hypothetical protein [Armatimonadota bacterium]